MFEKMKRTRLQSAQRGFTALVTMLVIAATTLLLARSSSFLGLDELDMTYTLQKGSDAFAQAESCLEETVRHIQIASAYGVGQGEVVFPLYQGACSVRVTSFGNERRIEITGAVDQFQQKITADIVIDGGIKLVDWRQK